MMKLMDINNITCEKTEQLEEPYSRLRFKFPTIGKGHKDYQYVNVPCPHIDKDSNSKDQDDKTVYIDAAFDKGTKLFLFDMRFGNRHSGTYHFFDTDDKGVIKKHVKVKGVGSKQEIILDNYELQKATQ